LSSTEIINHVNTTLFNILRESLGPNLNITFGSPADEDGSGDNAPRLYVFLYNIAEDAFSKNSRGEYRSGARLFSFKAPLTLNLYYMLTPFSAPSSSTTAEPPQRVQAHTMTALATRAFYDNALVNPKYFPANTVLGESQVRISSVQMNLEEITKIWSSFNKPFRMSVCYEVSVVQIRSEETPKEVHVVERAAFPTGASSSGVSSGGGGAPSGAGGGGGGGSESEFEVVPAIGKRNLSKLKDKGWNLSAMRSGHMGDITDVRPVAVQPGMALSIYGRNFKGKKLTVKIGDKNITDGKEIDAEADKEVDKAINEGREINATLLKTLLKTLLARLLGTTSSSGIDDAEVDAEVDKAISGLQEINATLLKTLLGRLLGTSFRVINENLIKVKISPNEKPGTKKLSLASEGKEEEEGQAATVTATTTFEVLPAEPRLITITEVRPDKGISGDLVTVYGINFTEEAKVSIGDREVTKVTFVDNTQINIMIPPGMASAMTTLNVKTDQEPASSIPFRIL
jgi:hypothetical protein